MVSMTHGLQLSCATVGLLLAPVHGFHPVHVLVVVTISGVNNIDPEESTSTLTRFFTAWASAERTMVVKVAQTVRVPITTGTHDGTKVIRHNCCARRAVRMLPMQRNVRQIGARVKPVHLTRTI